MSDPDYEPQPIRAKCSKCKSKGGDFWIVSPDKPYKKPNLEGKSTSDKTVKTITTTATCPRCGTINTIYWDIENSF